MDKQKVLDIIQNQLHHHRGSITVGNNELAELIYEALTKEKALKE